MCQNCEINPVVVGTRGRLLKYCSQECRNQYPKKRARLAREEGRGASRKCCRKCGESLPRGSFHQDGKRIDGLYPWCKQCRRDYMGAQPKLPPKFKTKAEYDVDYLAKLGAAARDEKSRRSHLWVCFRMTVEEYAVMLASQGGRCAICRTEGPGRSSSKHRNEYGRFAVDHDHTCCPGFKSCGSCVRGLLCMQCNTGLGALRDDPKILHAALAYLERPTSNAMGVGA